MSNFEKYWSDFDYLTPYLGKGVEYIEDDSGFFAEITRKFPIQSFRINWSIGSDYKKLIPRSGSDFDKVVKEQIRAILNSMKSISSLVICFDGYTQGAILIDEKIFVEYCNEILTIPQHIYIIPRDVTWCINYTFEDYLYFGYSQIS